MEFDYTNLRAFIKEHFHNLKAFANFLGIGTTQLGQRLANKVPLQRHMDNLGNKSKEGEETNINKKEPHDAAQKKWIIFRYFNALKYKKDQSLEEKLEDIRYCTRVNLGMFVIAVILTILNITRI